jgi:chaperonin cofactor prefoldin
MEHNCVFCSKTFSSKVHLTRHQTTTKSCLKLQGKEEVNIECVNCKKVLAVDSYRLHKIKCDQELENINKNKMYDILQEKYTLLEKQNKKLKTDMAELKKYVDTLKADLLKNNSELLESKNSQLSTEKENEKLHTSIAFLEKQIEMLERQNDKLHTSSTSITMKLAEKVNTVNNTNTTNNTVVINANQLTNEVLRQCAATFSMDNAHNIGGITRHLTTSLENHVTCTDPSRNIFKYTNENDEEITDHNLEILLPQYLTAVKDRNNFFYKEMLEYFDQNKISFDIQTDYQSFYTALNSIIEKNGDQNKYTEKCKQKIVKECKRRFLEKNKNKETILTRELTIEDVMMNVIETGGSVHDFVDRYFRYNMDDEETDEQFIYRREMEDLFRKKKREWRDSAQ